MTAEKDTYSSDTLERSNLSSLQSDLSSVKKDTRPNDTKIEISSTGWKFLKFINFHRWKKNFVIYF